MMAEVGLTVKELTAGYGDSLALWGVSIQAQPKRLTAIVGPNGAGKSTLLRTISGLIKPRSGKVTFNGVDLTGQPPHQMVHAGIVHVPEGRSLFSDLTVADNLRAGAVAARQDPDATLDAVMDLFPPLRHLTQRSAGSLSGGQQQMVAIGRGLMARPRLLMVDELSLGLAPIPARNLVDALLEMSRRADLGVLIVDQNVRLLQSVADDFWVLSNGRVTGHSDAAGFDELKAIDSYVGGRPLD